MKLSKLAAAAATLAAIPLAGAANFQIIWENHGPQPLSPLFWSVSDASFDIFAFGSPASAGIKRIAETGNATTMLGIAAAAGSSVQAFGTLSGGPLLPGQTRTANISADVSHGYFQFASMLGKTNDGFIGESLSSMGLNLFEGSTPTGFSVNIYGARAWDAGTEENTQNMADLAALGGSGNTPDSNSAIRVHETIVSGYGDSWQALPDWSNDTHLATVTVLPVPEPSSIAALALGAGLILRRKAKAS
ncbi:MAG: spondin domain-containing protein [Armatimonadetes bacterium]|nr:spondin domain-containing protein [Armatimonadota bacterium]